MEAFTFLKYWRGGGAGITGRTTVTKSVTAPLESDREDGPFLDLELSEADENGSGQPEPGSTDSESDEEFIVPVSPSDDLFFKGKPVLIQTGSEPDPDLNVKSQFSRLKSATNFRVLMLKLKKNKENAGEKNEKPKKETSVKFKIEGIPIKSVFKRENGSKSCTDTKKPECVEEKKVSKDVIQRNLKMVRVLKRGGGGRVTVDAAEVAVVPVRRRDDSLVQQQDGIQSAILHCKRSFNASRDLEFSILSRSVSDPSSRDSSQVINL